jgi:hypothetical protein
VTERFRRVVAALVLTALLPMTGVLCAGECNRAVQRSVSSDSEPCHDLSARVSTTFASGARDACSPFSVAEAATRERFNASTSSAPIAEAAVRALSINLLAHPGGTARPLTALPALPVGALRPLRI